MTKNMTKIELDQENAAIQKQDDLLQEEDQLKAQAEQVEKE